MRHNNTYKIFLLFDILVLLLSTIPYQIQSKTKDFVLVIDAGHGGHDPGALGSYSQEKDINLNVALRFGKLIKENCNDVNVIYTRKSDVFIPLGQRAEIANNAHANLFISIHTNSLGKTNREARGSSTWTLGLAKSKSNLDVAKRENSVILYENDYRTRYAGFNPNSSESYIIFELMQDKYMKQSVHLATLMQQQFANTCNRPDGGVHQAGFLVLKASAMPSILIELGFISTPQEEYFLNSENGEDIMANGIYKAFLKYKNEFELRSECTSPKRPATEPELSDTSKNTLKRNSVEQVETETKDTSSNETADDETPTNDTSNTIFKIQILSTTKPLQANNKQFKGLKDISCYQQNGMYKYTIEESTDYRAVLKKKKEVKKIFAQAFIVAFKNGERIDTNQAISIFKRKYK